MRKNIPAICLLLLVVSVPAHANPINYTINFTLGAGSPAPGSGSFTYDATAQIFSNFLVKWDGFNFDLTSSANAPFNHGSGCAGEASTPAYAFELVSETLSCPSPINYQWFGEITGIPATSRFIFDAVRTGSQYDQIVTSLPAPGQGGFADGQWTISPTTVPEPSEFLLMATGLLSLMCVIRKRRLV